MDALEDTGLTPADFRFYPAARNSVVDLGIVRRRKVDVAKDIPARRVADLPVGLDDEVGRSIREAERGARPPDGGALRDRARTADVRPVDGIDHENRTPGCDLGREDTATAKTDENVFSMMRRIGQAKAGLAADYTAQPRAQRREGRLLRQAHRRDGRGRGDLRQARDPLSPRSAATRRRRPGSGTSTRS